MEMVPITDEYLVGNLIGFTAGLAIAVLLLAFTIRAAKIPGTPVANLFVALCAFLWNAGGLTHTALLAAGVAREGRPALITIAIQFTGAAVWPIPVLAIWARFATRWNILSRILIPGAFVTAFGMSCLLWLVPVFGIDVLPRMLVKDFAAYNGAIFLGAGAVVLFLSPLRQRGIRISALTIVLALFGSAAMVMILNALDLNTRLAAALIVISQQSVLLAALGVFFLFTKFRFSDLFIRYSVRILIAMTCALVIAFLPQVPLILRLASQSRKPAAIQLVAVSLCVTALLLLFVFADRRIGSLINSWIFHAPDYGVAMQRFTKRLLETQSEDEIAVAVRDEACRVLELDGVDLIPLSRLPVSEWVPGILDGGLVEVGFDSPLRQRLTVPNVQLLIPISSSGAVKHVLAVSSGPAHAGLVNHEVNHLRVVAAQCGNRIDVLEREREMLERRTREMLASQHVTEAELRALRAQINPHFLFNSLNTIANLIVTEPLRAETMTLRLARVFRYVLAHSEKSLTSIREEMEFLRAYLDIEEARFRERLKVHFDVAPEIASENVPSLILQPIVENALKHGLGPKPDPGHLWISAFAYEDNICLKVEDDGVGLHPRALTKNGKGGPMASSRKETRGVGLTNVAKRLNTLYFDRASLTLELREGGGSQVTILIPRGCEVTRHVPHDEDHYR